MASFFSSAVSSIEVSGSSLLVTAAATVADAGVSSGFLSSIVVSSVFDTAVSLMLSDVSEDSFADSVGMVSAGCVSDDSVLSVSDLFDRSGVSEEVLDASWAIESRKIPCCKYDKTIFIYSLVDRVILT